MREMGYEDPAELRNLPHITYFFGNRKSLLPNKNDVVGGL